VAQLVLASASPRRRALLAAAGLAFAVEPTDVDETVTGAPEPEEAARDVARRKALCALARHRGEPTWIVAADTVVALRPERGAGGWRLLGKPADEAEARAMLAALSGTRHRVVTAVAVARCRDGALAEAAETTVVVMRPITGEEVADYAASGEWRDKAGGYALQETADRFVTALEGGGFDNVVGLPVRLTLALLAQLGGPGPVASGPSAG
jgi:septum formation protein